MSLTPTGFPAGGVFPTGFPGMGGPGGVSISGNTAGVAGLISTGTLILAGGPNITLSQNGNTISISGGAGGGGGNFTAGISGGNTSGQSGTVSGSLLLAGGNNVTLSGATAAGGVLSVTISAANQTNQTLGIYASSNTVGASSSSTYDARSLTIQALGNVSVGWSNGSLQISDTQTVQTQNCVDWSLSGNSTSAGAGFILISSGTGILAGGNNITLSQNGQSVTISAFNQTVQTQNVVDVTLAGNSTSAGGGFILISSGTMTLAGGNNITLSQNGNAVTISAFTQSAFSAGISGGNTAGNTGTVSNQVVFAGGNNITLSGSTAAGGETITISAFNQSVQTQNVVDVTLAGNTAGALALISSGTMTLAGGNNITLSQNGNAVTISDGMNTISQWWAPHMPFGAATLAPTVANSTLSFAPMPCEGYRSASQANFVVSVSASTSGTNNSTGAGSISAYIGVYTRGGTSLSMVSSGSQTYAWSYTSNISANSLSAGLRLLSVPINVNFTPGDYWIGANLSTSSSGNLGQTVSFVNASFGGAFLGYFASATAGTGQMLLGWGVIAASSLLGTVAFSSLTGTANAIYRAFPILNFVNTTA